VTGLAAAIGFEWLKLRRSVVAWTASIVLVLVAPLLATGLLLAARSDSDSQLAIKARIMVTDTGWSAQFAVAGQFLSVAVFVVVGIVACWVFGREYTDHAVGALVSLPVRRTMIASAKLVVVAAWAAAVCVSATLTTVVAGLPNGLGSPRTHDWLVLGKLAVAALLTVAMTTPLALAASAGRGYLTGIAVLLALVVTTQIATAAGLGGWFPYAAPGLWLGLGGHEAATHITAVQLLVPILVGVAGAAATIAWWHRTPPPEAV
jgi:ABC-2 type transport system permease protein